MVVRVCTSLGVSERRACRVLGQIRSTQHYIREVKSEEEMLTEEIVSLATRYGRYGQEQNNSATLDAEGWIVNHKRVERSWRKEGLKVPKKQSKKGRLWLNGGSCIRLRPEHRDHVWNYDLMAARTAEGKPSG